MSDFKECDSVIVSWDYSHGKDKTAVLVGKQEKGSVEIVNAFQGDEALEVINKLTTVTMSVGSVEATPKA